MRFACTFFLALVVIGCKSAQLPIESKIGYDPRTGLVNFSLPKNSSWDKLKFDQKFGTNTISLVIDKGSFTNSPLVLDAAGAANVAAINAWGGIFNSMLEAVKAMSWKVPMGAVPVPMMSLTTPPFQYEFAPPHSLMFTNKAIP